MTAYHRRAGRVADYAFLQKLEQIDFYIRQTMKGMLSGERRSAKEGSSIEWMDYSEYMPGDDYRRIDWNLAARFDKLYMKHFVGEIQTETHIYLDMSESMDWADDGKKSLMALKIAAALAYLSVSHADRASFSLLRGERCERMCEPVTGKYGFFRAMPLLDGLEFDGDVDIEKAICADGMPGADCGLSVLISDLLTDSDWKHAVDWLLSHHRQVMIIQVLAPEEDLPAYGGYLTLLDAEKQGEAARLNHHIDRRSLEQYKRTIASWKAEIESFCASRDVAFLSVLSNEKLEEIFLNRGAAAGVIR